ncbi:hypothetical protein CC1G_14253 [Coprinopsis cinerea okayama7|uniref:Uncharacterized protein n=1 Tax=Coprinopsis cinerea (strain Okayama-7 / 130 / ATCC MYA-4618 / FGSC 9003) TaxID=240176 RepID=D6RLR0_COPC7|nr:hypothetical protein CC1G_14253 [Coprinopsis cinerea okayama7\|eukprot:XP_002911722.1 hypothetical protein CC1G_14253 [Coprinopsis cinerea okayama7\
MGLLQRALAQDGQQLPSRKTQEISHINSDMRPHGRNEEGCRTSSTSTTGYFAHNCLWMSEIVLNVVIYGHIHTAGLRSAFSAQEANHGTSSGVPNDSSNPLSISNLITFHKPWRRPGTSESPRSYHASLAITPCTDLLKWAHVTYAHDYSMRPSLPQVQPARCLLVLQHPSLGLGQKYPEPPKDVLRQVIGLLVTLF